MKKKYTLQRDVVCLPRESRSIDIHNPATFRLPKLRLSLEYGHGVLIPLKGLNRSSVEYFQSLISLFNSFSHKYNCVRTSSPFLYAENRKGFHTYESPILSTGDLFRIDYHDAILRVADIVGHFQDSKTSFYSYVCVNSQTGKAFRFSEYAIRSLNVKTVS